MKSLVFDSSSVISLATNDLLWILKPLKDAFAGSFFIPESVRCELVDVPLNSHRFKWEAIMVSQLITEEELVVHEKVNVDMLLNSVNNIFSCRGQSIRVVSKAEIEALAVALRLNAAGYVVDERTMRLLVEDPLALHRILEGKLHNKIMINQRLLNSFKEYTKDVKILRTSELVLVALERGMLDKYVVKVSKKEIIDALLWGLRLRGCAIATEEIEELKKLSRK